MIETSVQDNALKVVFGKGGNSELYTGSGWSGIEPNHRWTLGTQSTIVFPGSDAPPCDAILSIKAGSFLIEGREDEFPIEIDINGKHLSKLLFTPSPQTYRTLIPGWAFHQTDQNVMTLHHPRVRVVDDAAQVDQRPLALAIFALEFQPLRFESYSPPRRLPPIDGKALTPNQIKALASNYTSLGNNCEFGLFQRKCGAEPASLLRFASIQISTLISGLESEFTGIDDPRNISMRLDNECNEYIGNHLIYGLDYHTFRYKGEIEPYKFAKTEASRLGYLARLLLSTMDDADSVFVIKRAEVGGLSLVDVYSLTFTICERNPNNKILWVEIVPPQQPEISGVVEQVATGIFRAYIDRFAPSENAHDLAFESWLSICATLSSHLGM